MSSKTEGTLRHFGIAFILALIVYTCFYSCDAHLRHRKGAWEVAFSSEGGEPVITIQEAALGIRNVRVIVGGEKTTNAPGTVIFDMPGKPIPFGRTKFEDLTYLPGGVVFDLFGHEVQLMPRTLSINKKEIPWKNDATIRLQQSEKLPPAPEKSLRSQSRGPFGRSAE